MGYCARIVTGARPVIEGGHLGGVGGCREADGGDKEEKLIRSECREKSRMSRRKREW